jgi:flagellar motility protein MotE (MotC chaperone)
VIYTNHYNEPEVGISSFMQISRLFILLILVSFFSFLIRIGDIVTEVRTVEQSLNVTVMAESEAPKDGKKGEPVHVPEGLPEDEPVRMPENDWADPTTLEMEFSETQKTVLEELKVRREELDSRETRINQHEALLKVTERRIEEKVAELNELKKEIEDLLGTQSKEEEARLQSLVKIYSGMKPKDAAAIFDNLDMRILIQVVGRMSERKTAPIMASMNIQIAQELTTLLAEQKKLPEFLE